MGRAAEREQGPTPIIGCPVRANYGQSDVISYHIPPSNVTSPGLKISLVPNSRRAIFFFSPSPPCSTFSISLFLLFSFFSTSRFFLLLKTITQTHGLHCSYLLRWATERSPSSKRAMRPMYLQRKRAQSKLLVTMSSIVLSRPATSP